MEQAQKEDFSNFIDRAWARKGQILKILGDSIQKRRASFATHKLEKKLEEILNTMDGHRANGVPPGSSQYVSLWNTADTAINVYCDKYRVARLQIDMQNPGLGQLYNMTHSSVTNSTPVKAMIGVAVGVITIIVLGCIIGIGAASYHWVFLHLTR